MFSRFIYLFAVISFLFSIAGFYDIKAEDSFKGYEYLRLRSFAEREDNTSKQQSINQPPSQRSSTELTVETIIEEIQQPFSRWPDCKRWILANYDRLRLAAQREGRGPGISFRNIADNLYRKGLTQQNWTWQAGYLDLLNRLERAGLLKTESEGGSIPDGGFRSWQN